MKFKEWINFNESFLNCDFVITVLNNSYDRKYLMLETLMNIQNAVKIFGEYQIKKFGIGCVEGSDYRTIKIVLWLPNN